jgi:heat shock protein HslJ
MILRSTLPVGVLMGLVLVGCAAGGGNAPPTTRSESAPLITPSPPPAAPAGELSGTSWRLEDLAGVAALPNIEATLEFPEAGKVAGRASCNRFFGTVEISGESVKFGPLASTKMACIDDATNAQEVKYLQALQGAERFAFDGPALFIYSKGMDKPLRFARK